jgi:hypothetical protein
LSISSACEHSAEDSLATCCCTWPTCERGRFIVYYVDPQIECLEPSMITTTNANIYSHVWSAYVLLKHPVHGDHQFPKPAGAWACLPW